MLASGRTMQLAASNGEILEADWVRTPTGPGGFSSNVVD
jgi:hypothetical protein